MISELTEPEYVALKAAIRKVGRICVPVVMTADGQIIDGKGRVRAAEELDISNYSREIVDGMDEEGCRLHRVALNCVRRQLSTEQKREVVRATLRASPGLSNSWVGDIAAVDDKTVAKVRQELESTSEIPMLTAFRGKDGKTRPRYATARNPREQREVAEALRKLGESAPSKTMTAREATRKAKRMIVATDGNLPTASDVPPDELVEIHHCDFRQMPVAPGSARLIFTDPLYHREHLPLYSELAKWAASVLQPGGFLVTYFGTSFLPEVVQRLGQHLDYVWTCPSVFAGQKTMMYDRHIRTGWKPLLVYSKGQSRAADWMGDVITAPKAKKLHRYQQPEVEAENFVRRLSEEQDLILDPFCGSGTTASVCKRLNRRCLTTDLDPKAIATARERVRMTLVGDPLVRPAIRTARMPMEDDDIECELNSPLSLGA